MMLVNPEREHNVTPQLLVGLWFDSAHHETIQLHNNKENIHTERSRSVEYL